MQQLESETGISLSSPSALAAHDEAVQSAPTESIAETEWTPQAAAWLEGLTTAQRGAWARLMPGGKKREHAVGQASTSVQPEDQVIPDAQADVTSGSECGRDASTPE